MGGLVGRRALNELCKSGKPTYLRLYASFDTPYGGVESAAGAVKRGTELIPSWVDVAAGSPFLTRLYETPIPKDLPFHVFFGWGVESGHGPAPAGDGTITLPSQLDPHVQAAATRMMGYGATHVGILSDPDALDELGRVLEDDDRIRERGAPRRRETPDHTADGASSATQSRSRPLPVSRRVRRRAPSASVADVAHAIAGSGQGVPDGDRRRATSSCRRPSGISPK